LEDRNADYPAEAKEALRLTTGIETEKNRKRRAMKRWIFFIYGVFSHVLFFAVYAYFCAFTANVAVAKSIDTPTATLLATAVAVDVALLLAFGLQHSVMARPWFKQAWTRFVPNTIERSTYVLISSILVILLMWQWRSIDAIVWDVQNHDGRILLWSLFAGGWLLVPLVSFMINHFDLFGTRQVWLHLRGQEYRPLPFRTPLLYAHVRHPLYIGWGLAFWATPTMTVGHLLFAGVLTAYMVLATLVEERDLIAHFGHQYEHYRQRVPKFLPRIGARYAEPTMRTADPSLSDVAR
jgi:protein-S-isoprenylcysteine O-methyltransferase Ste14